MLIAVILIPVLTGVLVPVIPFRKRRHMEVFLEAGVVFNTLLVWSLLGHRPTDSFILAKFTGDLAIAFRVDGMGMVFAGLVSFLWPLATLFSFEYMITLAGNHPLADYKEITPSMLKKYTKSIFYVLYDYLRGYAGHCAGG